MQVTRMDARSKQFYSLLFFLFFITYGYFFQGGGWNQNTRICLTRAIIHQQSFSIDHYREDSNKPVYPFVITGDWAYYDGQYYSNKSPGLSFIAALPFALTEYLLKYIIPHNTEAQVHIAAYAGSLLTTALFSALLCVLIAACAERMFSFSRLHAVILAVCYGFGTLAFSYSTTFYCHQPAAFFSFLAFVLAAAVRIKNRSSAGVPAFFSGFCAATAVLIEPSTVWSLACIFLYLLSFREGRKSALLFIAGCVPLGAVQLWYNYVCFDSPLASSYQYANDEVMWRMNGRLFGIPHPRRFLQLLVLPHRGLFFSSPLLLASIPGAVILFMKKQWRREFWLFSGITVIFIVFIACFFAWHGGSAAGPRYLLPAYPFLFMLGIYVLQQAPRAYVLLGCMSAGINLAITAVTNEIPVSVHNPLYTVVYKSIIKGAVSINPVPFSNFAAYPDIYKLADIRYWTENFNSFNLGEVLFPHHIASLIPLLCFWLLIGWVILQKSKNPSEHLS